LDYELFAWQTMICDLWGFPWPIPPEMQEEMELVFIELVDEEDGEIDQT